MIFWGPPPAHLFWVGEALGTSVGMSSLAPQIATTFLQRKVGSGLDGFGVSSTSSPRISGTEKNGGFSEPGGFSLEFETAKRSRFLYKTGRDPLYHQDFQVPKMEESNLVFGYFGGVGNFPYPKTACIGEASYTLGT